MKDSGQNPDPVKLGTGGTLDLSDKSKPKVIFQIKFIIKFRASSSGFKKRRTEGLINNNLSTRCSAFDCLLLFRFLFY